MKIRILFYIVFTIAEVGYLDTCLGVTLAYFHNKRWIIY